MFMLYSNTKPFLNENREFLYCVICVAFSFMISTPFIAYMILWYERDIDVLTTQGVAHIR